MSITISIEEDQKIVHDLLKASEIGKYQMKNFVEERIGVV